MGTSTLTLTINVTADDPDGYIQAVINHLRMKREIQVVRTLDTDHDQPVTVEALDADIIDNPDLSPEDVNRLMAMPWQAKRDALDLAFRGEEDRYYGMLDGTRLDATRMLLEQAPVEHAPAPTPAGSPA